MVSAYWIAAKAVNPAAAAPTPSGMMVNAPFPAGRGNRDIYTSFWRRIHMSLLGMIFGNEEPDLDVGVQSPSLLGGRMSN